jgi:hypothetical protein
MRDTHEPHDEFVERLAWKIGSEVRRREREIRTPGWLPSSRAKLILATAALVVVSMGLGGAVVAAAYQAQGREQRDVLVANYEQRLALAQQRYGFAKDWQADAERRVNSGLGPQELVFEGRAKLAEAEGQLRSLRVQLEEVRLTGHEPVMTVSAPLVSGHDFVTERWQVERAVPLAMLELERARVQAIDRRFSVGMANGMEVAAARASVLEAELALQILSRKLEIRQRFLKKEIDAAEAELRVLEAETELRLKSFAPRIELGRKEVQDFQVKVEVGTMSPLDLAQARLKLQELQTDMAKAELDLALIRKQIDERRKGR